MYATLAEVSDSEKSCFRCAKKGVKILMSCLVCLNPDSKNNGLFIPFKHGEATIADKYGCEQHVPFTEEGAE